MEGVNGKTEKERETETERQRERDRGGGGEKAATIAKTTKSDIRLTSTIK